MSDVSLLRNNAIVRNASVGSTPPHGPLKTGELPLVQVRQPPGGPQVQEGQQKPVTILPPKDADSAVRTGGLPMVKVRMTDGKAKPDNGMDEKVVIRDSKHGAVAAGGLPMIQVKMDGGKAQVQTVPNVAGAGPQIPAAPPVLSAPRVARVAANRGYVAAPTALATVHGYVARAAAPGTSQVRVARIAAPQVALPPVPELSTDQLMLCQHVVNKYLSDLVAADYPTEPPTEANAESDVIKLARATIATIDDVLVATAVRAEAAAIAASAPVAATPTIAAAASASISPTPSVSHVAGRVGARSYSMPGARSQRNSAMAPRHTARSGSPLPPVIVKMDGQRAVVQNQAEISQAKVALETQAVTDAADAATAPESTEQG